MNAFHRSMYLVLCFAIASALSGCMREPSRARHTVDEYLANPVAMDAKLKECANNPGDLRADPDCVNVKTAAQQKGVGSLRDLPPLGLVPPESGERADAENPNRDTRHRSN